MTGRTNASTGAKKNITVYALAQGNGTITGIIGTITTSQTYPKITFTVPQELIGKEIFLYFNQYGDRSWVNGSTPRFRSSSGIDLSTENVTLNRTTINSYRAFFASYKVTDTTITLESYNVTPATVLLGFVIQ